MSTTNCSSCGKTLATADILYTEDAQVVCVDCQGKREIVRDEKGAARNIRIASFTCLGAGLFGFGAFAIGIGLFFYAAGAISVAAGFFVLNGMYGGGKKDEQFTKHISTSERTVILVCTYAGLAIALFEVLVIGGVITWIPFGMR
jgi:hypothetical protein